MGMDVLFSGFLGALLVLLLQVIWKWMVFWQAKKKVEKYIIQYPNSMKEQSYPVEVDIADAVALSPDVVRHCCFNSEKLKIDKSNGEGVWEKYTIRWKPR